MRDVVNLWFLLILKTLIAEMIYDRKQYDL